MYSWGTRSGGMYALKAHRALLEVYTHTAAVLSRFLSQTVLGATVLVRISCLLLHLIHRDFPLSIDNNSRGMVQRRACNRLYLNHYMMLLPKRESMRRRTWRIHKRTFFRRLDCEGTESVLLFSLS